jgi:quinoprotein glucose dehydrogenase
MQYFICCMVLSSTGCRQRQADEEWAVYGGSNGRMHYSSLSQIDTSNVKNLEVAWTYRTGDAGKGSQMQANPLVVDGVLYGVSPQLRLFAVDARNGNGKWTFDPADTVDSAETLIGRSGMNACRGMALYRDKKNGHKLYYTAGSFLYCINANTGALEKNFGKGGRVLLHEGLDVDRDIRHLRVTSTSPGIVYKDLLIMGSSLNEEEEAAPGHIRAYDVHTGKIRWIFHSIPHPGEEGYETWSDPNAYRTRGGANTWGGFSLDEKRGIVFASTGTANPDFYGGKRTGDNLYANSVLAIDAATGKKKWHFQTVHHDLWDWDLPMPPALVTITKDGKQHDVAVQLTKQGFVFVLDRETGVPVYPVVERPVPAHSELMGEQLSPTQPFPTAIAPFIRQELRLADLNRYLPDSSYRDLVRRFTQYANGEIYTPPSLRGTIVMALNGGAEWAGPSVDPKSGILYINANEMPWIVALKENAPERKPPGNVNNLEAGKMLYAKNCRACHGADLKGGGLAPPLESLEYRMDETIFKQVVKGGRRMMPSFNRLSESELNALSSYLLSLKQRQKEHFVPPATQEDTLYKSRYVPLGYQQFLSKEGHPAIAPPWGTLSALDLKTGKYLWQRPFGETEVGKNLQIETGSMNYGGSVVTAGGLLFIAATPDEKFRAYHKTTGKLLFETQLPAAAYATPAVYSIDGEQFITLACGGGRAKGKSGDYYVTFRLKQATGKKLFSFLPTQNR